MFLPANGGNVLSIYFSLIVIGVEQYPTVNNICIGFTF